MHHISTWLDPRKAAGGYILPHLTAILLVTLAVVIAFSSGFATGWQSRATYDAHYFRQHYDVRAQGIVIPPKGAPMPSLPKASNLLATGGISVIHYPGVGDQGIEGACAAWANAWAISYDYRMKHLLTHPGIRFSPACGYQHYRVAYTQGLDLGSWFPQDGEMIPTSGVARFLVVPYPPFDPTVVTAVNPLCMNTTWRFPLTYTTIYAPSGGGQGLVDAMKQALSQGHPVMFGLPVTREYDNATQTQGLIAFHDDTNNRGGHANVALSWDDSIQFPNGDIGGFFVQNQWSKYWGLSGRAWISYRTAALFFFGVQYVTTG